MNCVTCQRRLTGGTDTFDAVHAPKCQACWLQQGDDEPTLSRVVHIIELNDDGSIASLGLRIDDVNEVETDD